MLQLIILWHVDTTCAQCGSNPTAENCQEIEKGKGTMDELYDSGEDDDYTPDVTVDDDEGTHSRHRHNLFSSVHLSSVTVCAVCVAVGSGARD